MTARRRGEREKWKFREGGGREVVGWEGGGGEEGRGEDGGRWRHVSGRGIVTVFIPMATHL